MTGGEFTDADRTSLYDDYIKPTLLKPFGLSEEDFSIGEMMISLTPTWFDETAKGTITILKKSEESKEKTKKTLNIKGAENLKYKPQLIAAETDRRTQCIGTIGELLSLDGWTYIKLNNSGLEPQAKKLSSLLIIPESEDDKINTKAKLDSGVREVRPMFYIDGVGDLYISKSLDKNVYYVEDKAGNNRTPMLDFLETYGEKILLQTNIENKFKTKADLDKEKEKLNKEKLDKIKQVELDIKNNMLNNSYYRTKKIIMEDIFEQQHYDFINSEDYFQYMKEFFEYEEKEALSSELNEL